ncbi:MAG TPA: hypothetical protein VIJ93_12225 [bacterium]
MKIFLFILFLGLGAGGYFWWSQQNTNDKLIQHFGVLPGSSDPVGSEKDGTLSLAYWTKLDYPPDSAVSFYGQAFQAKGWSLLESNGLATQNQWSSAPDQDPRDMKPACLYRYQSVWTNGKKDLLAFLVLSYYDSLANGGCPSSPKTNDLMVALQEMPKP